DVEFIGGVFVKNDFGQQSINQHNHHLALHHHPIIHNSHIFTQLELVQLQTTLNVYHVLIEHLLMIAQTKHNNLHERINTLIATALLDPDAKVGEITVEQNDQPNEIIDGMAF